LKKYTKPFDSRSIEIKVVLRDDPLKIKNKQSKNKQSK